jgi:hypothetical protein
MKGLESESEKRQTTTLSGIKFRKIEASWAINTKEMGGGADKAEKRKFSFRVNSHSRLHISNTCH